MGAVSAIEVVAIVVVSVVVLVPAAVGVFLLIARISQRRRGRTARIASEMLN